MQSKISLTCNLILFKLQKIEFGSWVSYSNAIMPNHVKNISGSSNYLQILQFPIKSYCTALLLLPPAVQNRGNKKKIPFPHLLQHIFHNIRVPKSKYWVSKLKQYRKIENLNDLKKFYLNVCKVEIVVIIQQKIPKI